MINKIQTYTSKLTPSQIKDILTEHKDPFYKFRLEQPVRN